MFEDKFEPFLDDGRGRISVEGMLQDDDVVL